MIKGKQASIDRELLFWKRFV